MLHKLYWVYIMASRRNGTLYVGVTNDIVRRAWEHREGLVEGFTRRYGLTRLVYAERHEDIRDATYFYYCRSASHVISHAFRSGSPPGAGNGCPPGFPSQRTRKGVADDCLTTVYAAGPPSRPTVQDPSSA